MIDPVSHFRYPDEWTAKCSEEDRRIAESGFGMLTSDGNVLKRGFTTGSTAAAAAFAAAASLGGTEIFSSHILLPCGLYADVPSYGNCGEGRAEKYAGDYPSDVTAGIEISARAVPAEKISLEFGNGVGRFTRDTPRYKCGDAAVSPSAHAEILQAVEDGCKISGVAGAAVMISIPQGEAVVKLTLNKKVGVEGGISVVGTTGFVEPWDDHLTDTMEQRIADADDVVITTGRVGLRYSRLLFPDAEVILAGSKIAAALSASKGCRSGVLCGLPGLILRFFHPDTAMSRGFATVEEMIGSPNGGQYLNEELDAAKALYPHVRIVILDREGAVIGERE
ncbi:MAG: cobalt-precorrin-5B (C(1))-methyltransferase [Methanocorpusculum sp.]|nr:cobalt-precorrin-5B (C(1))-methyltransferase [Methanocorpusculum sp.]